MNPLIVLIAKYLISVPALAALWLLFKLPTSERVGLLIKLAVASVLAATLSILGGQLYFDPRPFVALHVSPLFPHAADNGFPSDHTTLSMLVALLFFAYNRPLGVALVVVSLVIGAARVAALVHSPLDIAGSALFAAVSVWLAQRLVGRHPQPPAVSK